MIPTKQTITKKTFRDIGNCMQAAIASILELPLDSVPHFPEVAPDDCYGELDRFLVAHCNSKLTWLNYKLHAPGYCLYVGETNRTYLDKDGAEQSCLHVVVGENGKIVFDPHPDGTGLEKIVFTWLITPLEPWKIRNPLVVSRRITTRH